MIHAVVSNSQHPEYGVATIPFPIPNDEYDHVVELLATLQIGDVIKPDCRVNEVLGEYPVLKCLEGSCVNLDELDYLAKRLESFDISEKAQFQGMAAKLGISNMTELINLTFCCQQATVITDFSDLETIGRAHYMHLNDGCVSSEELDDLDGYETALLLIQNGAGVVTPYGVVYDNGMQLEQLYDGQHFPVYRYAEDILVVGISSRDEPENTSKITWLYLPCSRLQLERGMQRSGIAEPDKMRFWYEGSSLPSKVEDALEFKQENIYELNALAFAIKKLSTSDRKKLEAAVVMAKPEHACQIRHLAENLDRFEFVSNVNTPSEYGKYLIQKSDNFAYDLNLEGFKENAYMKVNAMTEAYEHIELFGKPALFTNNRLDRSTIPDGLYCYDIRGSDDDPGRLAVLEDHVVVNHAGAILSPEPIPFTNGKDYRRIGNKINFLGERLSVNEFCELHDLKCPVDPRKHILRPASPDEAGLFYALPPGQDEELGTIGHVRLDFGRSGTEFWHTWWPRGSEELNSPEFKAELTEIVDELRKDVLKDLNSMRSFCHCHGGEIEGGWRQNYGYIAETEHYRYCLRCNPEHGDYQAYLTCFDKRVQEMHQSETPNQGMKMGGM